jgi:hypothetical protein
MNPTKKSTSFLLAFLAVACATATVVALFNWLVNPFRLYFPTHQSTLTGEKPRPEHYQQQIRTELGIRTPSDVLILGNSTFEIGINPDDAALLKTNQSIFNHAIAGHSIEESSEGLPFILKKWSPKTVIINVAFADLLIGGAASTHLPAKSSKPNLVFRSLFSVDSTIASFNALMIPYRKFPETLTAKGHNLLRNFEGSAQTSGYHVLFETANYRIMRTWQQHQNGRGVASGNDSKNYDELKTVLKLLDKEKIKVLLVISPLHHDYKVNLYKYGLGLRYETWKQEISNIAASYNASDKIKLYDFGCTGEALRERIPDRNDKQSPMKFYWDAEHFKSALGTELVSQLLTSNFTGDQISTNLRGYLLPVTNWVEYHQMCQTSVPKP